MSLKDPIARAAYDKQYYKDHREKILKQQKQYNKDHREEMLAYSKQYNKDHREEKNVYNKQNYKDHREEIIVYKKQYNKDHREERKAYNKQYHKDHHEEKLARDKQYNKDHREERKQYRKDHPEVYLKAQKKLFKKLGLTRYQVQAWTNVIRKGKDCSYCGSDKQLHSHHIFPKSKYSGLALNENNGIPLCIPCHKEHHMLNGVN